MKNRTPHAKQAITPRLSKSTRSRESHDRAKASWTHQTSRVGVVMTREKLCCSGKGRRDDRKTSPPHRRRDALERSANDCEPDLGIRRVLTKRNAVSNYSNAVTN